MWCFFLSSCTSSLCGTSEFFCSDTRASHVIFSTLFSTHSHVWLKAQEMFHTNTTFTWSQNMATMEERISLLAQQVTTMTPDVSMLRSELAGSGAHFAERMVTLVKDDPRIKRDRRATIVSKVQALEARSADTASLTSFRSDEASDFKPNVWTVEKRSRSLRSRWSCRTGSEPCMTTS